MALAAATLMLHLPGCGVTPQRPGEMQLQHKSPRTPYAAAICIARNGRSSLAGAEAEERTLGSSSWEVVVRRRGAVVAVVEIHGDGVGSAISVGVTSAAPTEPQAYARQLVSGC